MNNNDTKESISSPSTILLECFDGEVVGEGEGEEEGMGVEVGWLYRNSKKNSHYRILQVVPFGTHCSHYNHMV